MRPVYEAVAFGFLWRSDLRLPQFFETDEIEGAPPLGEVTVCNVPQLRERNSGRSINRGAVYADGVRLKWGNEVVLDMFGGDRIEYFPGPNWSSTLPSAFFGTMAALTAAWRGALPLHASSIEIDGRAFLIAGRSGAGKSTLAADLLAIGAALVADDLTVLSLKAKGEIHVFAGRRGMRQHAATAATIASEECGPIDEDDRGKWLVRPTARTRKTSLPIGGILLLGEPSGPVAKQSSLSALAGNLFRPRWMAVLPTYPSLRRDMLTLASIVPVESFSEIASSDSVARSARAEHAMRAFRRMI